MGAVSYVGDFLFYRVDKMQSNRSDPEAVAIVKCIERKQEVSDESSAWQFECLVLGTCILSLQYMEQTASFQ